MFEITVRCSDGKEFKCITSKYMLCIEAERDNFGVQSGGEFENKELRTLVRAAQCEVDQIFMRNNTREAGQENALKIIEQIYQESAGTQRDFEIYINSMKALGAVHGPGEP